MKRTVVFSGWAWRLHTVVGYWSPKPRLDGVWKVFKS